MAFIKNWQNVLALNIGTKDSPEWEPLSVGVQNHGQAMNDTSSQYYYMAGKGAPEDVNEGVQEVFTISGHRNIGDKVQDFIFQHERIWNMNPDSRNVEYRWYNTQSHRGETGQATLSYTTTGSGPAQERAVIGLTVSVTGVPDEYIDGFTVLYNANGGTGIVEDDKIYQKDEMATIMSDSTLTPPSGKTFSKWNTKDDGTGTDYSVSDSVKITENLLLYAIWA